VTHRKLVEVNPRSCIVSREAKDAATLIRFVVSPQNELVPDIKRVLPGRGAWVSANRKAVREAVKRKLFARSFGKPVTVCETLDASVAELLSSSALGALGIANKAGLVITGFSKVDAAVRAGNVELILHGSDAAEDGVRKIESGAKAAKAAGVKSAEVSQRFTSLQLGNALGNDNLVHVAVKHGGACKSLMGKLDRLEDYETE